MPAAVLAKIIHRYKHVSVYIYIHIHVCKHVNIYTCIMYAFTYTQLYIYIYTMHVQTYFWIQCNCCFYTWSARIWDATGSVTSPQVPQEEPGTLRNLTSELLERLGLGPQKAT